MAITRWSDETQAALLASGWSEGRDINDRVSEWAKALNRSDGFVLFDHARKILREFGGLCVRLSGPGRECARSSFCFDPLLALGEGDRFQDCEPAIGEKIYPLGEADDGHVFIAAGESGKIYLVMDFVIRKGLSIDDAIDAMVVGRRGMMIS